MYDLHVISIHLVSKWALNKSIYYSVMYKFITKPADTKRDPKRRMIQYEKRLLVCDSEGVSKLLYCCLEWMLLSRRKLLLSVSYEGHIVLSQCLGLCCCYHVPLVPSSHHHTPLHHLWLLGGHHFNCIPLLVCVCEGVRVYVCEGGRLIWLVHMTPVHTCTCYSYCRWQQLW